MLTASQTGSIDRAPFRLLTKYQDRLSFSPRSRQGKNRDDEFEATASNMIVTSVLEFATWASAQGLTGRQDVPDWARKTFRDRHVGVECPATFVPARLLVLRTVTHPGAFGAME